MSYASLTVKAIACYCDAFCHYLVGSDTVSGLAVRE